MPHFSLLSEPGKVDEGMFCDHISKINKTCLENTEICRCIHRLKVKKNAVVDLFMLDIEDSSTHPFHLHGHKFYVMDMRIFNETMTYERIMKEGLPKPEHPNPNPPHKDTILIPNHGFVHLRFKADGPAFWLGHCHVRERSFSFISVLFNASF